MGKRLFLSVDPTALDQYTCIQARQHRRRKRPAELVRRLDLFTRSLHALPPRELQMLFQTRVLRIEQDEVAALYFVRQSNISFRLNRAHERIKLFHELHAIASETTLRRALINAQVPPRDATVFLAALKTVSQKLAAKGLGIPHSRVRGTIDRVRRHVQNHRPADPAEQDTHERLLRTFDLVNRSWNRLTEIEPQGRFAWKTGKGSRPRTAPATPPQPKPVLGIRRRGPHRYAGVQQVTARKGYEAKLIHDGRFIRLGNFADVHHAALATNIAVRLVRGPDAPEQNPIAPEHRPDDDAAEAVRRVVEQVLRKKGLLPEAAGQRLVERGSQNEGNQAPGNDPCYPA